jgi:Ca2+-binding RTX toxin-like protein
VNTYTTHNQRTNEYGQGGSVAMDANGDFVVTWSSYDQNSDPLAEGFDVYAQRYNAAGQPQGGEFRVNTYTTGQQRTSTVAMDADGDFVITWSSGELGDAPGQDGDSYGVYAQRYNAVGVRQGSEFRVNTFTSDVQANSTVSMDADGDFVVAWSSGLRTGSGQDGSQYGVYAQRYNAAGVKQGGEFRVNTFTAEEQGLPSVSMDATGNFVVVWTSENQDGSNEGVYGQRYSAAGVRQGGVEFRVNTTTADTQGSGTVAVDSDGDFVVTWSSYGQDGGGYGVYAQRYNASGTKQGAEFRVNSNTSLDQGYSTVAMDSDGDFVITWTSYLQDGSYGGIYAQRYYATGVKDGGEFRVNTNTNEHQEYSSVAANADGDFLVAWTSWNQDGSRNGVYAQRYEVTLPPVRLNGTQLEIIGTNSADIIRVARTTSTAGGERLRVSWNGTDYDFDSASVTSIFLDGRDGDDQLSMDAAVAQYSTIVGGVGNDQLTGGRGNDSLTGGAGNDTYSFDTDLALGSDTINESGGGIDTLNFSATTARAVNVNLANALAQVVNTGLTLTLSANNTIENVIGGSLGDTLTGNAIANVLTGGAGNDKLNGGTGKDILIGGIGADVLTGGSGENLLFGARYTSETNATALIALRSEWTSASSYENRVAHLLGTLAGGANGNYKLTSTAVKEDSMKDTLTGGTGKDWYLRNNVGATVANRDTVTDTDLDSVFTEMSSWL